nr:MAG TPA: hypothetical protein [Caudoviricetes sp.]
MAHPARSLAWSPPVAPARAQQQVFIHWLLVLLLLTACVSRDRKNCRQYVLHRRQGIHEWQFHKDRWRSDQRMHIRRDHQQIIVVQAAIVNPSCFPR